MTNPDPDDAPTEEPAVGARAHPVSKEPKRAFLAKARRNLDETELGSPVVSRFLIDELERLDEELAETRTYRDRFHSRDKELAVLQAHTRAFTRLELASFVMLAVGSAGLGASPSFITLATMEVYGWIVFGLSMILVIAGVAVRILK
jgi:hypothetical protein